MRERNILFTSLLLGSIGHLATDIYLPSMPIMTEYFGTSISMVQFTLTVYMLSFCITPLIIGPISDTIGRRKPILVGIYIGFLATILCAFSNNIYTFIFARFLQGIGLGTAVAVSRAILPDHFQGKQLAKYFSYLTMLMPIMLAIAPPLGGFIQEKTRWQCVFVFLLIYLFFLQYLARKVLKDKDKMLDKENVVKNNMNDKEKMVLNKLRLYLSSYKVLIKNKQYLRYSSCTILTFMGILAYVTMSPFYFQEVCGFSPAEFGMIAVLLSTAPSITGFINSRLLNHFNPKNILFAASAFIMISGILLIILTQLDFTPTFLVISVIGLYFLSVPLSFANAGALALSSVQGNFGAATALLFTLQYCGGSLGSLIISFTNLGTLALGITFVCVGILYCLTLLMPEVKVVPEVTNETV